MANTTQYDDEQRAYAMAVLKSNGGNFLKTSRQTGIPRTTLRQWAGQDQHPVPAIPDAQLVADRSMELADRFEAVAFEALDAEGISRAMKKAGLRDRVLGAAIATDKSQLLKGRPTSRNESLSVTLVASGSLNELGERTLSALTRGKV